MYHSWRITSCPVGYLLVNSTLDSQECFKCPRDTYSFDFTDGCQDGTCSAPPGRKCQDCPIEGVKCDGGDHFDFMNGSSWEKVRDKSGGQMYHRYRLKECPTGHVLVRDENRPSSDQCYRCPRGKYSIVRGVFGKDYPKILDKKDRDNDNDLRSKIPVTTNQGKASDSCHECPTYAYCDGGNLVEALLDHWIHPLDEAFVNETAMAAPDSQENITVYRCIDHDACLGGTRQTPADDDPYKNITDENYKNRIDWPCVQGRTGPVCGTFAC